MNAKETEKTIQQFLRNIKLYWQVVFLLSVLLYGLSLIYRLNAQTVQRDLSYFQILNWISFILALTLAISIFQQKRKYFSLRSFRLIIEEICKREPEFQEKHVTKRFVKEISKKLKRVWIMGGALILLGVLYYWWTFDAWSMHVYFIVGLYSLAINYPRRDLFADIPYLVHENIKKKEIEAGLD